MKRILIIIAALLIGAASYGQTKVNKRIMLDTLNAKAYSDSPTLTGIVTATGTLNTAAINIGGTSLTIDSIGLVGGKIVFYSGPDTLGLHIIESDFEDIRTIDSDTVPLFIFGTGSGYSADTALFNDNRLAGAFYNSGSDTLYVTELRGVLVEGTGTETIDVQVSWDVNMKDVTPTNLNTTALTITSMTTGTADASFNNNGIPPGVWVWCTLSGASSDNKPTMLILTMTGYKRNRTY